MATLALTVVGSYFGGPVGGAVGSFIGSLIDQELFGEPIEGPRIDDLKFQISSYGRPIPLVYGQENRVTGTVIWTTGLIETKNEDREGDFGLGFGGTKTVTYTYKTSIAIAINGRSSAGLTKIYAGGKLIYDATSATSLPAIDSANGQVISATIDANSSPDPVSAVGTVYGPKWGVATVGLRGSHTLMDNVYFYVGSSTQEANPVIESYEGATDVPGYRDVTYVVLENLQLKEFGNRIPNFEFLFSADTSIDAGTIIKDITDRSGIPTASAFGITNTVRGYAISRNSPAHGAIVPLSLAYSFDMAEQNGDLRFVRRSRGITATIPTGDMGATSSNNLPKEPIQYEILSDLKSPNEVSVLFKDSTINYQTNTARAILNSGTVQNITSQELPIVLSADQARAIADRMLFGSRVSRKIARFSLSDKWIDLSPGKIVGIPVFSDQVVPYKITRIVRGADGVLNVETKYEDPEVFTSTASGAEGDIPTLDVSIAGATYLMLLDIPLLADSQDGSGFYWAFSTSGSAWPGGIVQSSSSGSYFLYLDESEATATIGILDDTLGDANPSIWDRGNTFTVTLTEPGATLSSVTEEEVLDGANLAYVGPGSGIGGEIINFQTATLVSSGVYTISNMLRGRKGTEQYATGHAASDIFVLLDSNLINLTDRGEYLWNQEHYYRAVTFGMNSAGADITNFTNTGVLSKPYSPVHAAGARDGSNNLTITWYRRTRYTPGILGSVPPLGEDSEAYEVDIIDPSDETTVLRTISPITSETTSYLASEQTTDGLTPGDDVIVDIYQISATYGRGFALRATI